MAWSLLGFPARFWLLITSTLISFLGMGAVLPALPPHVRYDLGGSDQTVGFVIGIFSLVALGGRFAAGPLADLRGRKAALLVGQISCSVAGIVYLFPGGIAGAYGGRIFQGFGEACLYTGAAAWAVELAGIDRSAQALGYVSSGIWGGIAAGPAVGTWLRTFPNAAIFQTVAALAAAAVLLSIPEQLNRSPRAQRKPFLRPFVLVPGFAIGFVNVHYPVIAGFLILHLNQRGGGGRTALGAYALTVLLARFFLGGLPDRYPPAVTFFGGLGFMAAGLTMLAFAHHELVGIAGAVLLGFGFSFPWSSVASTVLRRTPENERGTTVSMLSVFFDVFVGLSSFAAGGVAKQFGYPAAFGMSLLALIPAAVAGRAVFRMAENIPLASSPTKTPTASEAGTVGD